MKLKFDIELFRKNPNSKIVTRDGKTVTGLREIQYHLYTYLYGFIDEYAEMWNIEGEITNFPNDPHDLFIITNELNELEYAMLRYAQDAANAKSDDELESITIKHSNQIENAAAKSLVDKGWSVYNEEMDKDRLNKAKEEGHREGYAEGFKNGVIKAKELKANFKDLFDTSSISADLLIPLDKCGWAVIEKWKLKDLNDNSKKYVGFQETVSDKIIKSINQYDDLSIQYEDHDSNLHQYYGGKRDGMKLAMEYINNFLNQSDNDR